MSGENREEYLEAIYGLGEDGLEASTGEIARRLGLKDASVTQMLKKLHDEGYIKHTPYKGVRLTERGLKMARKIKWKHRLLERFLYDFLKIRRNMVHEQACRMEHSLSDEAASALDKLMEYPQKCPDDGKTIPRGDDVKMSLALSDLHQGDSGTIVELAGGPEYHNRMRTLGVCEGKAFRVVAREPLGGPIVLKLGNTKVSLGRRMSSKIKVRMG
jgi:DtxR family transcriptional regulator, Mn-dependent transcriptional regulator